MSSLRLAVGSFACRIGHKQVACAIFNFNIDSERLARTPHQSTSLAIVFFPEGMPLARLANLGTQGIRQSRWTRADDILS
ncbi:MAG: hypothetical protein RI575_13920 [Balneolaceae bacterium]|nr:hypothetical protein [Balneolaceae bacterium]